MNRTLGIGTALLVLGLSTPARAQTVVHERVTVDGHFETPTHALELYGASVYTQGFGELQSGVDMARVITPGIGTELGAGYRFDPRWVMSIVGQYAEFAAQRATSARSLVAGLTVAYNMRPYEKLDPWIQFGAGYRWIWESNTAPTPDLLTQGFELAKVTLGLDVRASRDISMGPLVGVDLTLPLWQSGAIADPRVSAFVFAGLLTRFDVTRQFVRARTVSARRD